MAQFLQLSGAAGEGQLKVPGAMENHFMARQSGIILVPAVDHRGRWPSQWDLWSRMLFRWLQEMTAVVSPAELSFILRSF